MLLFGVLIGPFQYFHTKYASGQVVSHQQIFGPAALGPPASTEWKTPVTVELSPAMNPVGVFFDVDARVKIVNPVVWEDFHVQLTQGDAVIWERPYVIGFKGRPKKGYRAIHDEKVCAFNIASPGAYTLSVTQTTENRGEVKIREVDLVVRRNIEEPRIGMATAGFCMIAFSLVGFYGRFRRWAGEEID